MKSHHTEDQIKKALDQAQVHFSSIHFIDYQKEGIQPFFIVKREDAIDMIQKRQLSIVTTIAHTYPIYRRKSAMTAWSSSLEPKKI